MTPQFRTERLLLRHLEWTDAQALTVWHNDAACRRYQCWKRRSLPSLQCFVLRYRRSRLFSLQREQHYAICLCDGTLVGDVTIFFLRNDSVSIGYTIFPPFQRNGYAYELLSALLPLLHEVYRLDIFALVHPENIASISLLKKLNFFLSQENYEENVDVYTLPYRKQKGSTAT